MMADRFEIINVKGKNKNEIIKAFTDVEYYPTFLEDQTNLTTLTKLPFSRVPTLGVAFEPLAAAFQNIISGGGAASGLYRVTVPTGGQLAAFKDGSGYLGSVLTANGAVGGGQAVLNPLVCNPTMLFMALALANIDKKLDDIKEMQKEILDFLVMK